ncbi:hypothetical protein [Methanofollis sp. UBA420]|uniref:hypothetical protein n=1 Tax=Methanofollis sp. UBA420 TaxID=1915514 RepID=UPI00316AC3E2
MIGKAAKKLPPPSGRPGWQACGTDCTSFSVDREIVRDVLTHEIPAQKPLIRALLDRTEGNSG